jgi:hypothetical protein
MPLSRLKPPAKSYVQLRSRFVGLPREIAAVHLFPSSGPASLSSYRPLNQLRPGSSFRGVPPPQSSFAQISRSSSFDTSKPTQGLVPHRDITGRRLLPARGTKPSLRSVLRFSQPLDGFLRPPARRACSIPPPRPGLSPFRGFSPRAAVVLIGTTFPPAVVLSSAHLRWPDGFCFRVPSRSPAATLREASASRLSSARGRVVYGLGLAAPHLAPLFGFFSSRSSTTAFDPGFPGIIRSRRFLPGPCIAARPLRPPSAFCSGGLDLSVSVETNLPETFEPSDRSLHGVPRSTRPTARPF